MVIVRNVDLFFSQILFDIQCWLYAVPETVPFDTHLLSCFFLFFLFFF